VYFLNNVRKALRADVVIAATKRKRFKEMQFGNSRINEKRLKSGFSETDYVGVNCTNAAQLSGETPAPAV